MGLFVWKLPVVAPWVFWTLEGNCCAPTTAAQLDHPGCVAVSMVCCTSHGQLSSDSTYSACSMRMQHVFPYSNLWRTVKVPGYSIACIHVRIDGAIHLPHSHLHLHLDMWKHRSAFTCFSIFCRICIPCTWNLGLSCKRWPTVYSAHIYWAVANRNYWPRIGLLLL